MTIPTVTEEAYRAGLQAQYADCLWAREGAERIHHGDMEAAIEEAIDDLADDETPHAKEVTIVGWRPERIRDSCCDAKDIAEMLLDRLDEEHGDPDDATEATPRMIEAAEAFRAVVMAEYEVWSCHEVVTVVVPIPIAGAQRGGIKSDR